MSVLDSDQDSMYKIQYRTVKFDDKRTMRWQVSKVRETVDSALEELVCG